MSKPTSTIEQKLASTAAETVTRDLGKDYRNACESLPTLLLQSGLLPTLAYLDAGSAPLPRLGEHLKLHLSRLGVAASSDEVPEVLSHASSAAYQTFFELALKAAVWQKRIAKAVIPKDEEKEAANHGR